jgi:hypothetical protein
VGVSLEERIRQSLEPLVETLRIDTFLSIMARERARLAAIEAQRVTSREESDSLATAKLPLPAVEEEPREAGAGRDEVDAFMRRDEAQDASANEIADFLELSGGGFDPADHED